MTRKVLVVLLISMTACRGEEAPPAATPSATPATTPASAAASTKELHVGMTESGQVLQLPPAMSEALRAYAPQFRPWDWQEYDERVYEWTRPPHNLPVFASSSDMNADGITDLALYGHDDTHELLFVLLSEGSQFRAVELLRVPLPPSNERIAQVHYLEPAPSGRTGFMRTMEGGPGVLYYWKDGRFHEEAVGD